MGVHHSRRLLHCNRHRVLVLLKAGDKKSFLLTEAANKGAAISIDRGVVVRVFAVIFLTTALGGVIFQSTTYALPKFFELRLQDMAAYLTLVGVWSAFVFAMAAFAQLVAGHLEDKHSTRTIFALVAASQAVLFAIMINMFGAPALIISLAFMLVVFGQIPINVVLVGRVAKNEWRSGPMQRAVWTRSALCPLPCHRLPDY